MSLATRCTACGTIFRVVQDQLKVSEGWVRCGRCQEVFSALEGLFDLERESPPQRKAAGAGQLDENGAQGGAAAAAPERDFAAAPGREFVAAPEGDFVASRMPTEPQGASAQVPATREDDAIESRFLARPSADERDDADEHPEFADARFPSELPLDAALDAPPSADEQRLAVSARAEPASELASEARDGLPRDLRDLRGALDPGEAGLLREVPRKPLLQRWRERRESRHAAAESSLLESVAALETSLPDAHSAVQIDLPAETLELLTAGAPSSGKPSFVRQAENAARWHRPRVRASLIVAALLLGGVLAAQMAEQFRDAFAVQWPQSRPAIELLCELRGCSIEPLRRLAAVAVESSALTPGDAPDTYQLRVVVDNRAAFAVAAPSVELSLTDASGALLVRRALAPSDFRLADRAIGPGGKVALEPGSNAPWLLQFAAPGLRVSGYTLELFFP